MDELNRLRSMGLSLPPVPRPVAVYVPAKQVGNLVWISGQTPTREGKLLVHGKLGKDLTVEQGQEAARIAMLNCLAILHEHLHGDLGRVKQVIQVVGYVASAEGFGEQPLVVNGASQLLVDCFGERGKHTRLALGVNELPFGAPVEVTLLVEIHE